MFKEHRSVGDDTLKVGGIMRRIVFVTELT